MFCLFIEIYLSVRKAIFKIELESCNGILKKFQLVFFLQYVFKLTAWKIAVRTAHQLILKVQKPIEGGVSIFVKISRGPVPLNFAESRAFLPVSLTFSSNNVISTSTRHNEISLLFSQKGASCFGDT